MSLPYTRPKMRRRGYDYRLGGGYFVMPDHMHGILFLTNHQTDSGISLSEIIRVFKSTTTTQYIRGVNTHGWARFTTRFWQLNFYDHIIRNDADLDTRRQYIALNPARWEAKQRGYL